MGRAEDLFNSIIRDGEEALEQFFVMRQSEELFLDFKRSADNGSGRTLHQNDLTNLAKAISGFGNSEGGLLIWGIDCNDKDGTGDFPKSRVPIEEPDRFVSRLEASVSGRTVPPHPGVRHVAVKQSTNCQCGFVATLVPKYQASPLQTVPGLDFYVRAGSSFVKASHGLLAGLYGHPPQPKLTDYWTYSKSHNNLKRPPVLDLTLTLFLRNEGPGIASDMYICLDLSFCQGVQARIRPVNRLWTGSVQFGSIISLISDPGYRLPPGASIDVLTLDLRFAGQPSGDFETKLSFGLRSSPTTIRIRRTSAEELSAAHAAASSAGYSAQAIKEFVKSVIAPRIDDTSANNAIGTSEPAVVPISATSETPLQSG